MKIAVTEGRVAVTRDARDVRDVRDENAVRDIITDGAEMVVSSRSVWHVDCRLIRCPI